MNLRLTPPPALTAAPVPQEYADLMWPELPSLVQETIEEIGGAIPEYAQLLRSPYGRFFESAVECSLTTFVTQVAEPATATDERDKLFRRIGWFEALEGRSLEYIQLALRISARAAIRRASRVVTRHELAPATVLTFAEAVVAYVDDLEQLAREGHRTAMSGIEESSADRRRRLLRLIVAGGDLSHPRLAELAAQAEWPIPTEATLVALGSARAFNSGALDGSALVDLEDEQPYVLVPGPFDEAARAGLYAALVGSRAAVGLTTAIGRAADSLRWARRLLELSEAGVVDDGPVADCENHLMELLLLSDPPLARQLTLRQLAPLDGLTDSRRRLLIATMRTWLATRGTALEMGEQLDVHPQTVRYRLRKIENAYGDRLKDPDFGFATEFALRALELDESGSVPDPVGAEGAQARMYHFRLRTSRGSSTEEPPVRSLAHKRAE